MARQLDGWLSSYLDYTENTEPPKSYNTWVAISTIAAVLQRKCYISFDLEKLYPNMYIVLVGPASCRKGTALSIGYDFLEKIGIKMAPNACTKEALISRLEKSIELDPSTGKHHCSLTI